MTVSIGQLRYNSTGNYCTNVTLTPSYVYTSAGYQDVILTGSGNFKFQTDTDYYIKAVIPRDTNYDNKFSIKLTTTSLNSSNQTVISDKYQFIKTVDIGAGADTSENNYSFVIVYQLEDSNDAKVFCAIPEKYTTDNEMEEGIVYQVSANEFYIKNNGQKQRILRFNTNYISHSWMHATSASFATIEMIFRPQQEGFTALAFELVRTSTDLILQEQDDSGNIIIGRRVPIKGSSAMSQTAYSLKNLVPTAAGSDEQSLTKIGLWGHSGLMFAVNGEELRIGPSGYYELSQLDTESLSIVAPNGDFNNAFTLDFEYTEQETSS